MATQFTMEDATVPKLPGASGGNSSMRSPSQEPLALSQSPPSERAELEEARYKAARLERETEEVHRLVLQMGEELRGGQDSDTAVKDGVRIVRKLFDLPQRKSDLAVAEGMATAMPVDETALPWGPRAVSAIMVAQRVVSGGGSDINAEEMDVDSADFMEKFSGAADRCYGEIMQPKEDLCVPKVGTCHLERPDVTQMPVLEHTAREFVDASEPSGMGAKDNRSTTEPTGPPLLMEKIERCLYGITAAMSAGEWFGFATDIILAKLQQGIDDPEEALKDLRVLRCAQRAVETDVSSLDALLHTTFAQDRHLAVINEAWLQGLPPDLERYRSTVESRGDEVVDGRLKEFFQRAGANTNRTAAQNREKCVLALIDQKQQIADEVVTTTTLGSYSTPSRREDHNRRSPTDRVDNYNNRRDTK